MKSPGSGILAGKKTYVTAVLGIAGAIAAYLTGEATVMQAFQTIITCLSAGAIRHGISTTAG